MESMFERFIFRSYLTGSLVCWDSSEVKRMKEKSLKRSVRRYLRRGVHMSPGCINDYNRSYAALYENKDVNYEI